MEGLDARKAAIRMWSEFAITPPVPIKAICGSLGISYHRKRFEKDITGLYVQTHKRTYIAVNSLYSPQEQLIAGAHELGHWLIHHKEEKDVIRCALVHEQDTPEERLCERFAIEFALPEHACVGVLYSTKHSSWPERLHFFRQCFGVPEDIVERRLWELGLYCP